MTILLEKQMNKQLLILFLRVQNCMKNNFKHFTMLKIKAILNQEMPELTEE